MNDIQELIEAVHAAGASIRTDGFDIKIKPANRVPADIKALLKERKAEVLERLQASEAELPESMKRLESAGITVAVLEDGTMRILLNEAETIQAINDAGVIYSSKEMLMYITLSQRERRMLHGFKKQFGGTAEWSETI